MKKYRRFLVIAGILCLILCVLLSGCKKKDKTDGNDEADKGTVTPAPSPSPSMDVPPVDDEPEVPEEKTELIGTVVNVTSGVNVRSGPSTESNILMTAELGTQFKVVKEFYTSEWHKVEYEDGVAYINAEYLQVTAVPVDAE
ncbi:MAG: SH3 domain-containing protein [Oscillospiraceae bacterium]|nr:SH3 domain-containing protein [Oscillospiraceae bacterium]